ncbi:hypothetical protein ACKVEX_13615 [Rhodocyclaceae bacterium SMB388]
MTAFINGPVPEHFEREVAASPAEFERDLRKAWPAGVTSGEGGVFRLGEAALALTIRVEPKGERRLGLLALPLLQVQYDFAGGDEAMRRALLLRLDRAMQRGGG